MDEHEVIQIRRQLAIEVLNHLWHGYDLMIQYGYMTQAAETLQRIEALERAAFE